MADLQSTHTAIESFNQTLAWALAALAFLLACAAVAQVGPSVGPVAPHAPGAQRFATAEAPACRAISLRKSSL
ncbi:MAG: hypothetical protein R3E56_14800 [Burkholderiaceae bacterium]